MYIAWALLVVILDQVTKALVVTHLPLYEPVTVVPGLITLIHVQNPGAAFGLLPFKRPLFIAVAAALVAAAAVFRRRILQEGWLVQAGIGLGLGGAVGNMVDRVRTGMVTDFIQVPLIPVFNVADTAIVVGVALLMWGTLFAHGRAADGAPAQGGPERRE